MATYQRAPALWNHKYISTFVHIVTCGITLCVILFIFFNAHTVERLVLVCVFTLICSVCMSYQYVQFVLLSYNYVALVLFS